MRLLSTLIFYLTCGLLLTTGRCRLRRKTNSGKRGDGFHVGKQKIHRLLELSEQASKRLANLNDYTRFYTTLLKRLLRVRVPGTVGHHEVKKFIIKKLEDLNWEVKIDEFDSPTPFGVKRFTNIVATLDPRAHRRIAIAAHYDSKYMVPESGKYFIGATDSAVPCAIMLDLAETLHSRLFRRTKETDVTLQLLFFDGEEAFVKWNDQDSLYGSRHLAEVMSHRSHVRKGSPANGTMLTALDGLILLDLIGAKSPQFLDLFPATSDLYNRLQVIEKRLAVAGQLEHYDAYQPYFVGKPPFGPLYVEDDHIPFIKRGVPVLHLISIPFPDVWHKVTDDEAALDQPTIENMLKIFRVFVAEYLHLN